MTDSERHTDTRDRQGDSNRDTERETERGVKDKRQRQ